MLCDFHIHSTFSDGRLSVAQLVDLYGQRGFGAIAITDHLCEESSLLGTAAHWLGRTLTQETFPEYLKVLAAEKERAWREYRMVLIPGYELTKNSLFNQRSAHVLCLGVEKFISADFDIYTLLGRIRAQNGISIAAHPVATGDFEPQTYFLWSQRHDLAKHFDAWEVASGSVLFEEVLHSGLPMIANSDLHHPRQISSWKTLLSCGRDTESIFNAIKAQDLEFTYYSDPLAANTPLFDKISLQPTGSY